VGSRDNERQEQGIFNAAKTPSPVIGKLFRAGYRFNFFQAVSLLEEMYQNSVSSDQEGSLGKEVIRFQPSARNTFPAAEIRHIRRDGQNVIRMVLTFMGLYGIDSPLPPYFSDLISVLPDEEEEYYEDSQEGVKSLRHFLDIFNHRLYTLYYRSWKKYRYYLHYKAGGTDRFSQYMLSLLGIGTQHLQESAGLPCTRLISYSGALGQQMRCADGLRGMISDYFGGIDVKIIGFMPRWVAIAEQYKVRLITRGSGVRARLGENVTIGSKIRDFNGKFRLVLGPLRLGVFRGFLPSESNRPYKELYRLVRLYTPDLLTFDIEMLIRREDVPSLRLLRKGEVPDLSQEDAPAQLGWTSWLGKPREDVVSIAFSFDRHNG